MKATKLVLLALLIGYAFTGQSQDLQITKKDSIVASSWIFGLGFNAVDDAGSEFTNVFNFEENWNVVPFPSRLSIGKYFKNGLGLEAIGTYNQYMEGKNVDGAIIAEDTDYYAIDFRASYDLNKILGRTGWFDPYVGVGAGYTDANNQGRGTYNATVGFRTWFSDRVGLDFNSTGKWAMNNENATNHLQHAVGVVYQFGIEKGLSTKGLEKLVLLKEIEEQQQRVQDSIADAKKAERLAMELAEDLKRKEEKARLVAEEEAKLKAENDRIASAEKEIKDLGFVYFDLNSSFLKKEDIKLLDSLIDILNENSDVRINVSSYTDSRGSATYNLWLSERRLQRTVDYLMNKGIPSVRIQSKAKGESNLTNECDDTTYCSDEKHRKNRRTEFSIVKM